jgi:hypothetical protein
MVTAIPFTSTWSLSIYTDSVCRYFFIYIHEIRKKEVYHKGKRKRNRNWSGNRKNTSLIYQPPTQWSPFASGLEEFAHLCTVASELTRHFNSISNQVFTFIFVLFYFRKMVASNVKYLKENEVSFKSTNLIIPFFFI